MNKKFIVSLAAIILVAAAIGGWLIYRKNNPEQHFIDYQDPKLEQAQLQPFLDRIKEADKKLAELPKDKKNSADHYQILLTLGSEYYPIGEYKKALDNYEAAVKMFPNEPVPYYAMATIDDARHDYQGSLAHINRAIELAPTNPDYWKFKISLLRDRLRESPDVLNALYLQALNSTKEHTDIITEYARFLSDVKGDLAGAVQYWKKAIEKNSEDKAIYESEIKDIQNRLK
jgi:tetratricopeptide (TPR) repeat protein